VNVPSYAAGRWHEASSGYVALPSAIDGHTVASVSSAGLNFGQMADFARATGGCELRKLTFHQRAAMLKALAVYLNDRREPLYELSYETGATKRDSMIDIDGGIGTLFAYSSKGRRELPDERFALDGAQEGLSKRGTFVGQHILTPLRGVAVHINAYNFPCWGMLEKFAPAFLAGVPVIVKPASATSYLTHAMFALIVESGILPAGAAQLVVGSTGDLLEHLDGQDVISFTGSLETSLLLQAHPNVARQGTRFVAERDSLNAAILGPDAAPGTPEFDLFVKEVVREMTAKAGQKCTAIRRALVPRAFYDAAAGALVEKLGAVVIGNPRSEAVTMGALATLGQRKDVLANVARLMTETDRLFGDFDNFATLDADAVTGAFMPPLLLATDRPLDVSAPHEIEAFGPVSTLMPYDSIDDAVEIVRRGAGSLVASVFTYDDDAATELILGISPFHGRIIAIDRDDARESTGHGSPLPGLTHGGPGRAGGGEELGGVRGVFHYMQRTAIQASPGRLASLTKTWTAGAPERTPDGHPFRKTFDDLHVGETLHTEPRTITLADIEHFAEFTGDKFYAHMDEAAARANPFFEGRVAHGYLILAFAAGLFVDPAPGPVLANYGLERLRFLKPVSPGDAIAARLTVRSKSARQPDYGEVHWDVAITNQDGETVATYELLTMNATNAASAAVTEAR